MSESYETGRTVLVARGAEDEPFVDAWNNAIDKTEALGGVQYGVVAAANRTEVGEALDAVVDAIADAINKSSDAVMAAKAEPSPDPTGDFLRLFSETRK